MATMTKAIVNGIYPKVNKSLTNNTSKYKKAVSEYMSSRSDDIHDIGPMKRIYFGIDDINAYYKALGITEAEIQAELNKTYYANLSSFNPAAAKDPFTVTQLMVIRYYIMKNQMKDAELASIYLAFSGKFYPSLHYKFFPKVQPSEYRHVMEYVINNELSQKYDLKREGSLFGAVKSICNTWIESYKNKFKSSEDDDCVYVIQQLHDRLSSFMKNIAEIYYRVYEDKDKYLTYDADNFSDENFHLADNNSLKTSRYIEVAMNYITTNGVSYKYCKMAADKNVHVDEIKSIIESIQDDRGNLPLIKELISCIVIDYVNTTGDSNFKDIGSFLTYSIASKPNSKDPNVIRQDQLIEKFLDENSSAYRKRKSRPDTKNSYKKSIIKYYALIISQVNK